MDNGAREAKWSVDMMRRLSAEDKYEAEQYTWAQHNITSDKENPVKDSRRENDSDNGD